MLSRKMVYGVVLALVGFVFSLISDSLFLSDAVEKAVAERLA